MIHKHNIKKLFEDLNKCPRNRDVKRFLNGTSTSSLDYSKYSTHTLKIIKLKIECELIKRQIKEDNQMLINAEKELLRL